MYVNKIFYVFCFQGISLGFDFQQASEFLEAARGIAFTAAQAARDRLIQYCTVHQQTDITIRVMNGGRPPNAAVEASCAGRIEIEDRFSLCNAHGTCLPTGTHTCNGSFTLAEMDMDTQIPNPVATLYDAEIFTLHGVRFRFQS